MLSGFILSRGTRSNPGDDFPRQVKILQGLPVRVDKNIYIELTMNNYYETSFIINEEKDKKNITPAYSAEFLVPFAFVYDTVKCMSDNKLLNRLRTGKSLSPEELKEVKKVSVDLLTKLKEEKLKIDRWRESRQITAQVKTIIFDTLQWLPQTTYSDLDISEKTINVYQYIYANYPGGQFNTYTRASKTCTFCKALINRLLIENYEKPSEIHKRPLAKFSKDIARQLHLIS